MKHDGHDGSAAPRNDACGFLLVLFALAGPVLEGCRSVPLAMPELAPGHAACPVCLQEGDLPCIDVEIEPTTPTTRFEGRDYFFCSGACRERFLREPARYRWR